MDKMSEQLRRVVREVATTSGMPITKIAEQVGITQSVLNDFMRGVSDIRLSTAQKLCDRFGLRLMQVPGGTMMVDMGGKQQ